MTLIGLVILLVIVGAALYLIPMDARIKNVIYVVVVIILLLFLLQMFGVLGAMNIAVPRAR